MLIINQAIMTFGFCFPTAVSFSLRLQKLLCTDPPLKSVTHILINRSGDYVALIGSKSVTVMVLPERRDHGKLYENGKANILCKYDFVFCRFSFDPVSFLYRTFLLL